MTQGAVTTRPRPLLLAGEPVSTEERHGVVFPYDGSEVAEVCLADGALVERALASAASKARSFVLRPSVGS